MVVGTRRGRDDPFGKRLSSAIFWGLYRRFVQRQMPPGGIDVFACNKIFRDQLLELQESNTTLVGLILWMGLRCAEIPYDRRDGNMTGARGRSGDASATSSIAPSRFRICPSAS